MYPQTQQPHFAAQPQMNAQNPVYFTQGGAVLNQGGPGLYSMHLDSRAQPNGMSHVQQYAYPPVQYQQGYQQPLYQQNQGHIPNIQACNYKQVIPEQQVQQMATATPASVQPREKKILLIEDPREKYPVVLDTATTTQVPPATNPTPNRTQDADMVTVGAGQPESSAPVLVQSEPKVEQSAPEPVAVKESEPVMEEKPETVPVEQPETVAKPVPEEPVKTEGSPVPQVVLEHVEEMDEQQVQQMLNAVRSLFNLITPSNKGDVIREFLELNVSKASSSQLEKVVDIIFDQIMEKPLFCHLYAEIYKRQDKSFRAAVFARFKRIFEENMMEKNNEHISKESEEDQFWRRKFANISFIAQLYNQSLVSTKIIQWCLYHLLRHTHPDKTGQLPPPPYQEKNIECAIQLIAGVGRTLKNCKDFQGVSQYLEQLFAHLLKIAPDCSPSIRSKIFKLRDLRDDDWTPREVVALGPGKYEHFIAKKIQEISNLTCLTALAGIQREAEAYAMADFESLSSEDKDSLEKYFQSRHADFKKIVEWNEEMESGRQRISAAEETLRRERVEQEEQEEALKSKREKQDRLLKEGGGLAKGKRRDRIAYPTRRRGATNKD